MLKTINHKMLKVALVATFATILAGLNCVTAVPLAPGAGPVPIVGAVTNSGGTIIAATASAYNDPVGFSGFVNTYVIDEGLALNPLGGYTFFYNVDNDINGRPVLDQEIDFAQFNGFVTSPVVNADFSLTAPLNGGTAFPTDVSRSNASPDGGNSIVFGYNNPADPIGSGDVSAWMFVRTSTRTFADSTALLVGNGTATASIFAPVPEPTTVLFGLALFGVVGFGRRRS